MRFAIIEISTGAIIQINEMFGATEALEEMNNRMQPSGLCAIECGLEVGHSHVYSFETETFGLNEA